MDSTTLYTERQRGYTVPKLLKIQEDRRSARLAYQDVDYLLDLIEDDDLEGDDIKDQREDARNTLLKIKQLQDKRVDETRNIEEQRSNRRVKRLEGRA
jgi:hypothetical protein